MKTIIIKLLAGIIVLAAITQTRATEYPSLKPSWGLPEKAPEIHRPCKPIEIEPYRPVRPLRPRPVEVIGRQSAAVQIDPLAQDKLAVNGTDGGCIKTPIKPIRSGLVA